MLAWDVAVKNAPWPDIISNHPWSIVFMKWCAVFNGAFIINWVDNGTKYHIIHLAKWDNGSKDERDFIVDGFELIIQANNNPVLIINNGSSLINIGNIIMLVVSKVNQLTALPAIIDIMPSSIVGRIIFIFSLMLMNALDKLGPQSTIKLNRTE